MTGEMTADANGLEKVSQKGAACVPGMKKGKKEEEENACRIRDRNKGGGEIKEIKIEEVNASGRL